MNALATILLIAFVSSTWAFSCYTCNNRPEEDDTAACRDRIEDCAPGITACSSVQFRDLKDKLHYRKFCTAPGTPLYHYLSNFPGSSLCQNIEMSALQPANKTVSRTIRQAQSGPQPGPQAGPPGFAPMPPSPPQLTYLSTLLCICTKPQCNIGTAEDLINNSLLQNLRAGMQVKPGKDNL